MLPMLLVFTSLPTIVSLKLAIITTAVVVVVVTGVSVTTAPLISFAPPSVVGLPAMAATSICV